VGLRGDRPAGADGYHRPNCGRFQSSVELIEALAINWANLPWAVGAYPDRT